MSISSDTYEQREYELFERIKLLEQALKDIKEIVDIKEIKEGWNWLDEMQEINHIIKKIPNL